MHRLVRAWIEQATSSTISYVDTRGLGHERLSLLPAPALTLLFWANYEGPGDPGLTLDLTAHLRAAILSGLDV